MINILIGENSFLIDKKIKNLTSDYTLLIYNTFSDFFYQLQKLTNNNIWGSKKDLVIKNLDKIKKEDLKILIDFLKQKFDQNFILIFNKEPLDFINLLRKNKIKFKIINIKQPQKREIEDFIKDFVSEKGLILNQKIIQFLKENYEDNIELLINDLEKLSLLTKNPTLEDIKNIIHFQTNVFKIQDYFLDKNWPLFIHNFKKFIFELKDKNEIFGILSLLFNSLFKIYLIKKGKIKEIEGNSFYLSKLQNKAKNLSFLDIKFMIEALAKTDKKLKKFYINFKEIPEDIVLNYSLLVSKNNY
jgi:DNA polymerase III delta subunit